MDERSEKRSLLKRIARGLAANGFGQLVTILVNFVSVAFFYRFWGIDLYGEWVILSAIPTYLTMSDLSFGTTAGSEMTMLVAQGKRIEALRVLQSAWILVTGVSLAILVVMLIAVRFVPLAHWLHLMILSDREAMGILTVLLIGVALSQQGGLLDAVFKCSGSYAQGIFLLNVIRLIEFFCGIGVLVFKGDPWIYAMTQVVPRGICYMLCWGILRKKAPWLHLGWSYADKSVLKPLVTPALTFNAFNLGYAFSIQGLVLLVGARSTPADAAIFGNLRTLARVVLQGASAIANSMWVELSTAVSQGNYPLAQKLHRRASQISLWLVIPSLVGVYFVGKPIFRIWTGKAAFDDRLFLLLLGVTLLGSIWSVSYVVPLSINKHQKTALTFIITAAGTLFLASLLMTPLGVIGAAIALLIGEAVMVCFVLSRSLHLLHDHPGPFLVQLLTPPFDLVMRAFRRARRSETADSSDNNGN